MADHVAPLNITHSTPLRTERVLAKGRPRNSERGRSSGSSGATRSHSSSVISRYGVKVFFSSVDTSTKISTRPWPGYQNNPNLENATPPYAIWHRAASVYLVLA